METGLTMRYFTLDWYHSLHRYEDDAPIPDRTVWPRYRLHLEEMQSFLPADLLALARLPGVDDGLVVFVRHDLARRVLSLTLRAGDRQMGYYDLVLHYEGADISPNHELTLARVARTTVNDRRHESDVAFHELDMAADGRIEHRILFHPGLWFSIRCAALRWVRLPRPNRRLSKRFDRFPGGPVITTLPSVQT